MSPLTKHLSRIGLASATVVALLAPVSAVGAATAAPGRGVERHGELDGRIATARSRSA